MQVLINYGEFIAGIIGAMIAIIAIWYSIKLDNRRKRARVYERILRVEKELRDFKDSFIQIRGK